MFDWRGSPSIICGCLSQMWVPNWVMFDDEGVISAYSEEMKCAACGSLATAPMPGVNI